MYIILLGFDIVLCSFGTKRNIILVIFAVISGVQEALLFILFFPDIWIQWSFGEWSFEEGWTFERPNVRNSGRAFRKMKIPTDRLTFRPNFRKSARAFGKMKIENLSWKPKIGPPELFIEANLMDWIWIFIFRGQKYNKIIET